MAVIKIACPRCGQKVSGDDSFFGTSVDCPVCSSKISFPEKPVPAKGASTPASSTPPVTEPTDSPPKTETSSITLDPVLAASTAPEIALPASEEVIELEEIPSPLLGILSMVVGILNACTGCTLSLLLAPVGIICGHLALARAKHSPIQPAPGRTMALVGVILGYVGMVVLLIGLALLATGVVSLPFTSDDATVVPTN